MPMGLRSLLFGVHQVLWHPFLVLLAWVKLYGWPRFGEVVAIFFHDWGYAWSQDMEGASGLCHPEWAARLMAAWFGPEMRDLVLYHSRSYARAAGRAPSRLCWADKLSLAYEPMRFYLWRARLSGELAEYRARAVAEGLVPASASDQEWFLAVKESLVAQIAAVTNRTAEMTHEMIPSNGD